MSGDYLTRLIDGIVVDAWDAKDEEFGEVTTLVIKKGDQEFACWVMQDPEGNGPGWLSIKEITKP